VPLQPEQDANVFLAQRQHAARLIAPHDAGTPLLAKTARQMLADTSYRANARRLQAILARTDGASVAAAAILGVLDGDAEHVGHPRHRAQAGSGHATGNQP
jgi:UDP:flavonoid glycosyltransferase YjiC (YdhE family)